MISPLTLTELLTPLQASLQGAAAPAALSFQQVSTDSRSLVAGDLFVALVGERFDGHDYLQAAAAAGACAALVQRAQAGVDCPQLVVADTTRALGQLAGLARTRLQGPLVALTGSCGKTTTKEMLARVLARRGRVHVTAGNLNNHIGVPLTLLAMPAECELAVIEMGASGPGEIDYLAAMARPDVALVTNVMAAHLEGFGSEAGVAREKSRIYHHLRENGVAVINLDEPYAAGWRETLGRERPDLRQLTFACGSDGADVWADDIGVLADGRYRFELCTATARAPVTLPLLGRQNVANAVATAACALAVGLDLASIAAGLEDARAVAGRLQPGRGRAGGGVIDDTYNANPGSVLAAARLLRDLQEAGRDTALVLGDLAELGDDADAALANLGHDLAGLGLVQLFTLGNNSRRVGEGFADAGGRSRHFSARADLIEHLNSLMHDNLTLLVKGSRSARMEEIVQAITTGDPA